MNLVYQISAFVCLSLYACISLLKDALRYGSFGYLQEQLEKKYAKSEKLETLKRHMESYFEDDGRNLRELDWAAYFLLFGGLLSVLQLITPDAGNGLVSLAVVNHHLLVIALSVFVVGGFFLRVFSEPFSETILIRLYPLWKVVHILMWPLSALLDLVQAVFLRMAGRKLDEEEEEHEQKILDSMIDGEKAGVFGDSEREMIENLLEFKDREVCEVMTPRTDMVAVRSDAPLTEVVERMKTESLSRIIVFHENRDNVVGFVHVRDMLPYWNQTDNLPPLKELVHRPYFVPETKKIRSLFQEFKNQHQHIAVVLDEYGGTAGIVTLEDILEEIVGEIVDEHQDDEETLYTMVGPNECVMSAKLRVTELNEIFSLEIEESDQYDSIGGLIIAKLGRIPVQGEQGNLPDLGLRFKILNADQRKIERLTLTKVAQDVAVS